MQADVIAAFLCGILREEEKVYIKCLLVSRSIVSTGHPRLFDSRYLFMDYGWFLSPHTFLKYLTEKLWNLAHLKLSLTVVLHFQGSLCLCYVDGLTFWGDFVDLIIQLCAQGINLEWEDDAIRFLWVHIEWDPKTSFLNLTQNSWLVQARNSWTWCWN